VMRMLHSSPFYFVFLHLRISHAIRRCTFAATVVFVEVNKTAS
jgi:hypothetical protein